VFRIYAMKDRVTMIRLEDGETIDSDDGAMNVGKPGDPKNREWCFSHRCRFGVIETQHVCHGGQRFSQLQFY
ncbi:TrbG/VirB9 family P-type conjugative transfer protein, partial [Salmonella enterica subsp. enterica serovar Anatum]|nr:TrbG/VirB9 family P-type conjugative transfer protein [Salmonella enterica subsp. enterica serovar Anatum]